MTADTWFLLRTRAALADSRPVADGFLVQQGLGAMQNGTPQKKRVREARDRLLRGGFLAPDNNLELYHFDSYHICNSASQSSGIIKAGNCSEPQAWRNPKTNRTLKEFIDERK